MIQKNIGLFIGRFQPLTKGHCLVIDQALKMTDLLVVAIGSSQKEKTDNNPFSSTLRMHLISEVYKKEILQGKIIIALIPDREKVKDDSSWGEYLLNNVQRQTGKKVNIIFEGKEDRRDLWFESNIRRIIIDKNLINICASDMRKHIIDNDYDFYKANMHEAISTVEYFDILRNILLRIK